MLTVSLSPQTLSLINRRLEFRRELLTRVDRDLVAAGYDPRSKSPIRVSLPRFHFRVGLHIVLFEIPWPSG